MYESFDLIVYNGSHKVPSNEVIRKHSRVMLHFPVDINMFVLSHGILVHNGAASKFKSSEYTIKYVSDLCAFAHVDKIKDLPRHCRLEDTNLKPRENHNVDPSLASIYNSKLCYLQ